MLDLCQIMYVYIYIYVCVYLYIDTFLSEYT